MGILGDKTEKINLFPQSPNEKIFYFKNQKTTVRIDDHFIRISRGGSFSNLILQGLDGEKTILLSELTAYQLKSPGMTVGYFQFIYPGSQDTKKGAFEAVKDENTVTFLNKDLGQALALKKYIEEIMIMKSISNTK
ncbi:DUF4429 domain-containing protein [Dellaglioa sp. P0083]|uniref:DUF4429 domain-containing protein n=1 Tax=Dellaglioa kimchii TaxID=3344667 RepID=UPI0038D47BAF